MDLAHHSFLMLVLLLPETPLPPGPLHDLTLPREGVAWAQPSVLLLTALPSLLWGEGHPQGSLRGVSFRKLGGCGCAARRVTL